LALTATAAAIAIALVIFSESDSSRIAYHLSGLRAAQQSFAQPTSMKDYFNEKGWEWLRSKGDWLIHAGRWNSDDERSKAAKEHRQALLRLGYFEQREFTVNCKMSNGGEADQRFFGMRSRLPLSCHLWQVQVTPLEESSKVVVCASTADMILWAQMIRDFNNRSEVVK